MMFEFVPWFVLRSTERTLIICGKVMTMNCGYMPHVAHGRTADLMGYQQSLGATRGRWPYRPACDRGSETITSDLRSAT